MDAERDETQRRVAARLAALGLRGGDRAVLLRGNDAGFLDLALGALRAGVLPVPLSTALPPAALADLVADADPAVVFVAPELAERGPAGPRTVVTDERWLHGTAPADDLGPWPQARPMHYTSGTTGRSKGVHSGLLGPDGGRALAADEHAAWAFAADVHLVAAPLYHSAPLRFAVNTLLHGGRVVVLPRFDAPAVLDAIAAERVTTTFLVPTHLRRLVDHPAAGSADLSSIRWLAHAGAACPTTLKRQALQLLPPGSLWEFYGSTEGQFTLIGPDEWQRRPGSVGRARPGRPRTVLDEGGRPRPPGEVGLVYSTAPAFARFRYWRDDAGTAQAWDGDRFTVGDLGHLDEDGYLTLAGRRGDLVISGGVNVYPAEIERVLADHPGVGEGVVFGVPDEEWGERVVAAVVPAGRGGLDPRELRAWLRERLAGYQTPKEVLVVDELPRTGSGKLVRHGLAERLGLRS